MRAVENLNLSDLKGYKWGVQVQAGQPGTREKVKRTDHKVQPEVVFEDLIVVWQTAPRAEGLTQKTYIGAIGDAWRLPYKVHSWQRDTV